MLVDCVKNVKIFTFRSRDKSDLKRVTNVSLKEIFQIDSKNEVKSEEKPEKSNGSWKNFMVDKVFKYLVSHDSKRLQRKNTKSKVQNSFLFEYKIRRDLESRLFFSVLFIVENFIVKS